MVTTKDYEKSLKQLLAVLAAEAGCDVPEAEEDGRYLLELDDGLGVALMPASNEGDEDDWALVVSFVLGTIANASPEFLAEILEANYMWALSANGSFAIEAESGQVVLRRASMARACWAAVRPHLPVWHHPVCASNGKELSHCP